MQLRPNGQVPGVWLPRDNNTLHLPLEEEAVIMGEGTESLSFKASSEEPGKMKPKHFIEANTEEVSLYHLQNDCIIPVFSKDNEVTISHHAFIETVWESVRRLFRNESVSEPEIRVSHIIKGRTPEAIHKPVKELTEADKTIYYERMAFCMEIPSITETIGGNRLNLTIGGVRAYNQENLYSRKGLEKFKVFIGFKNMVCCNLCVATDGLCEEIRAADTSDLMTKVIELLVSYNAKKHLEGMKALMDYSLSESQFAQMIGKARLYQYLPQRLKKELPAFSFTDTHINVIAKNFYTDTNFSCDTLSREINMWRVFNLLTEANKCSYIDSFLGRAAFATLFSLGITDAIDGKGNFGWFLK